MCAGPASWGGPTVAPRALKRLCFYYPDAGEHLLTQHLCREVYDDSAARDFVFENLIKESDPLKRHAMFASYLRQHGRAMAIGVAQQLSQDLRSRQKDIADAEWKNDAGVHVSIGGEPFPNDEVFRQVAHRQRVLNEILPLIGGPDALISVTTLEEQKELIESTTKFRSAEADRLIPGIIRQAQARDFWGTRFLIDAYDKRRTQTTEPLP